MEFYQVDQLKRNLETPQSKWNIVEVHIWCKFVKNALIQIMSSCLFGTEPLSKALLGYCQYIGPLGINFSEILIKISKISFTKMHLKWLSAKCQPFYSGGDELVPMQISWWVIMCRSFHLRTAAAMTIPLLPDRSRDMYTNHEVVVNVQWNL